MLSVDNIRFYSHYSPRIAYILLFFEGQKMKTHAMPIITALILIPSFCFSMDEHEVRSEYSEKQLQHFEAILTYSKAIEQRLKQVEETISANIESDLSLSSSDPDGPWQSCKGMRKIVEELHGMSLQMYTETEGLEKKCLQASSIVASSRKQRERSKTQIMQEFREKEKEVQEKIRALEAEYRELEQLISSDTKQESRRIKELRIGKIPGEIEELRNNFYLCAIHVTQEIEQCVQEAAVQQEDSSDFLQKRIEEKQHSIVQLIEDGHAALGMLLQKRRETEMQLISLMMIQRSPENALAYQEMQDINEKLMCINFAIDKEFGDQRKIFYAESSKLSRLLMKQRDLQMCTISHSGE